MITPEYLCGLTRDELIAKVQELETEKLGMQGRFKVLNEMVDTHFGTPCEQVQHQQALEAVEAALQAERARSTALAEALRPFAIAGLPDACAVSDQPIRERNRTDTIIWSYFDSGKDINYRIMLTDLRRAARALAAGQELEDVERK